MSRKTLFEAILFFALFAGLPACGKKGPPLPPFSQVPEKVAALSAEGKEGGFMVSWRMPEKNEDGSTPVALAGFRLFRRVLKSGCRKCPAEYFPYAEIDLDAPGSVVVEKGKLFFRDLEVAPGKTYQYRVAPYNRRGVFGQVAETEAAYWLEPPPAPTGLHGRVSDRSAEIAWEPVPGRDEEGFAGYNLYRSEASGEYPLKPVNDEPVWEGRYSDSDLENNRPYYYIVRALVTAGESRQEGPSSKEIMLVPVDLVPPPVPTGLSAVPTAKGVRLFWSRVDAKDLLGYTVYRKSEGGVALERMNEAPVSENHYLDEKAEPGKNYSYVVTAVDNSPQKNESEPSPELAVKVPK